MRVEIDPEIGGEHEGEPTPLPQCGFRVAVDEPVRGGCRTAVMRRDRGRPDAEYAAACRYPDRREAEYGVARLTARRAAQELRERGLIVTVRGKGSFVVERPPGDGRTPSGLTNETSPQLKYL
ncbi:GntR family transcriptional regulator [Streptomyces sp. NPDC127119]|uniref:GntR family transcriptional regulator n=1 Tax=Streptomyces sp. NPDC127119 TaxID=3345370 RepID=UPI00362FAFEC